MCATLQGLTQLWSTLGFNPQPSTRVTHWLWAGEGVPLPEVLLPVNHSHEPGQGQILSPSLGRSRAWEGVLGSS